MEIDYGFFDEATYTWANKMMKTKGIYHEDLKWYNSDGELLFEMEIPSASTMAEQWVVCGVFPANAEGRRTYDIYAIKKYQKDVATRDQLTILAELTLPKSRKVDIVAYGNVDIVGGESEDGKSAEAHIMVNGLSALWFTIDIDGAIQIRSDVLSEWSLGNMKNILNELYQKQVSDTVCE